MSVNTSKKRSQPSQEMLKPEQHLQALHTRLVAGERALIQAETQAQTASEDIAALEQWFEENGINPDEDIEQQILSLEEELVNAAEEVLAELEESIGG